MRSGAIANRKTILYGPNIRIQEHHVIRVAEPLRKCSAAPAPSASRRAGGTSALNFASGVKTDRDFSPVALAERVDKARSNCFPVKRISYDHERTSAAARWLR